MAKTLGEQAGGTVGYRVRMQTRVSARTRMELVTEGVFTRMILDDPGLEGVAAVVFDEFHERSLDADLGLALARDAQGAAAAGPEAAGHVRHPGRRPRLGPAGRRAGDREPGPPVPGRDPPPRPRSAPVRRGQAARAVQKALARRPAASSSSCPARAKSAAPRRLLPSGCATRPWTSPRSTAPWNPASRTAPSRPAAPGRRKVVLATSIAETSLTIEGVRVVDRLRPVPRAPLRSLQRPDAPGDPARRPAPRPTSAGAAPGAPSRASATACGTPRRTAPWSPSRARRSLEADLSRLALDLARWGAKDAASLAFLDPPPATAFGRGEGAARPPERPGRSRRPHAPRPGLRRHPPAAAPGPYAVVVAQAGAANSPPASP